MSHDNLPLPSTLPAGIQVLMGLRGQFASLRTLRDMKVRKGQVLIIKDSTFVCRVGVNYDAIKTVKEGRADGSLPAENQGLPWGEWVQGLFPYVIAHKGAHYFRCTSVNGNASSVPVVRYIRDGKEITKEEAMIACLASEFTEKTSEVFTVKVESIMEINGKPIK